MTLEDRGSYSIKLVKSKREERVREVIHLGDEDLLEGKYRILGEIGSGGMGVVYKAVHTTLDSMVAIKVLLPTVTDVPNVVERFTVEAKSAASIRHPNIVEVTDFGLTPDRRPFFVMEYLKGESLAERLQMRGSLPEREVVEIADQILSGLSVAHSMGVIHRDLKPENVFLATSSGGPEKVKLLDFGVAKIISDPGTDSSHLDELPRGEDPKLALAADGKSLTMHGMVLGTPGYLAPETASNRLRADKRSDLFSVGVLLYEMLVGKQPFNGKTVNDVLLATMKEPVPRLSDEVPSISKAMERMVYTALAKMPEQRFQTTGEFMRHLTAAAVGRIPDDARDCVTEVSDAGPQIVVTRNLQDEIDTMASPVADSKIDTAVPVEDRPPAPVLPSYLTTNRDKVKIPASTPPIPSGKSSKPSTRTFMIGILILMAIVLVSGVVVFLTREDPAGLDPRTMEKKATPMVTIWLQVKPRGASVLWNGAPEKSRPLVVPMGDEPAEMTVSAPGHVPQTIPVVPSQEQSIKVVLEPIATERTDVPEEATHPDGDGD